MEQSGICIMIDCTGLIQHAAAVVLFPSQDLGRVFYVDGKQ